MDHRPRRAADLDRGVNVAFIVDVFAPRIVAWHASTSTATDPVMTPLGMAQWARDREGHPAVGWVERYNSADLDPSDWTYDDVPLASGPYCRRCFVRATVARRLGRMP